MLINITRKPKDKQQTIKECLSKYLGDAQWGKTELNTVSQNIIDIFENVSPEDETGDIVQIVAYTEIHEYGITLYDYELREIYEVLNANGFRWER